MDVDGSVEPPQGLNITACLVLNQRDDERLGFDFVSFPGNNEVFGVIDLTPGAHFIYVKKDDGNDDIDMRLGEFVYVPSGTCTVLKRSKVDNGPLFDVVDPHEARSYHSSVVAGHFSNKLARVPHELRELWKSLTEFITEDVIRALRPLERKVASKSKFNIHHSQSSDRDRCVFQGTEERVDGISHTDSGDSLKVTLRDAASTAENGGEHDDIEMANSNVDPGTASSTLAVISHCNNKDKVSELDQESVIASNMQGYPKEFVSLNTQEDDTVEDYIEIVKQFKGVRNSPGLICEALSGSKKSHHAKRIDESHELNISGYDGKIKSESDAKRCSESASSGLSSNTVQAEAMRDADLAEDHCTVYYSDLRRINRKMTLLTSMTPEYITQMHLDNTYILDAIASNHRRFMASSQRSGFCTSEMNASAQANITRDAPSSYDAVIGEYQYAFCLFLLNFHYDSFEHWKAIFRAICGAETFFVANAPLGQRVLNVMKLQLETFESDLYEPDNFFAYHLNSLEEIIMDNQPQLASLLQLFQDIRDTFKLKFGISLDDAKVLQDNIQIVDAVELRNLT